MNKNLETEKKAVKKDSKGLVNEGIDKKKNTTKTLGEQIRIYFIPLLSILILFIIIFLAIIPSIQDLLRSFDEKTAAELELSEKKAELEKLMQLSNSGEIDANLLEQLNEIIPTSQTDVVAFEGRVSEIADNSNVSITDVLLGERIFIDNSSQEETETEQQNFDLELVQIQMQFSLSGSLDNLRKMLSDIYKSGDFIVITQMELVNVEGNARMDLILSKYQYLDFGNEDERRRLLDSVSIDAQINPDVLVFIERKIGAELRESGSENSEF